MADKEAKRADNESVKVNTPLEDYQKFMAVLDPLNTLMGGTRAMRAAAETYLPKEKEEETDDYNSRLARTYLVNYFKRTIEKLAGEVFSKPINVPDEMNPIIDEILFR